MKPIFNHIRWGEFAGFLTGLSGVLVALQSAPLPEQAKGWVSFAVALIAFVLAFFRNPKSLDWVDEAQAAAVAYKQASEIRTDRSDEL